MFGFMKKRRPAASDAVGEACVPIVAGLLPFVREATHRDFFVACLGLFERVYEELDLDSDTLPALYTGTLDYMAVTYSHELPHLNIDVYREDLFKFLSEQASGPEDFDDHDQDMYDRGANLMDSEFAFMGLVAHLRSE